MDLKEAQKKQIIFKKAAEQAEGSCGFCRNDSESQACQRASWGESSCRVSTSLGHYQPSADGLLTTRETVGVGAVYGLLAKKVVPRGCFSPRGTFS